MHLTDSSFVFKLEKADWACIRGVQIVFHSFCSMPS